MKNVMVRAWEIAREAVVKFGGKVKEYFAAALAIAWKEVKTATSTIRFVLGSKRGHKSWIAQITGKDARYGLKREFLNTNETDEDGNKVYHLADGIYEFTYKAGARDFIEIENGVMTYISAKRAQFLVG